MIEFLLSFWCRHFHDRLLRPVSGKYTCAICLRTYDVQWPVAERWAKSPQVEGAADSIVLSVEG